MLQMSRRTGRRINLLYWGAGVGGRGEGVFLGTPHSKSLWKLCMLADARVYEYEKALNKHTQTRKHTQIHTQIKK